jgi:hypothetical protein
MFSIRQPSAALNSTDLNFSITMKYTYRLPRTASRDEVIDCVIDAADQEPDRLLRNVVINSHGWPGYIAIGREGFGRSSVSYFESWAGRVHKIWVVACYVAEMRVPNTGLDGNLFCSELARAARCYVLAPTETQLNRAGLYPPNQLPNYEGLLMGYGPNGNVVFQRRYPSVGFWYEPEPYHFDRPPGTPPQRS